MRHLSFLFLVTLLLLIGCGERGDASPTPFPTTGAATTPVGAGPVTLTITELMAAPGLYQDAVVQLTGRLRKQPLVVCDSDLHASPAGWGLAEEGVLALAGGYEEQVRSLLPGDLQMNIEGRWRRWSGLVGCGKQAQQQEVWYVEVSRILSPSPLTQVTLTPGGEIAISAVTAAPTEAILITPEGSIETPAVDEVTPELPDVTVPPQEYPDDGGATPSGIILPTPSLPGGQTPTFGPTPGLGTTIPLATTAATTGTPPAGTVTGTVTTTPPAGSPTPTVTGTPPTPTATATGGAPGQVVSKGNLLDELPGDFLVSNLAAGKIDSWELDIFEDEAIRLQVIAPPPADIIVSILLDGEMIVDRQNISPAGSAEVINDPTIPGEGVYEVQVSVNGGAATDYAVAVYTDPEFPVVLPGILISGTPRSAVQQAEFAWHYWFFVGNSGDEIRVRIMPSGNGDPALYLYGPDGIEIDEAWADENEAGEEEIMEITLPATGFFSVGIDEIDGNAFTYDLEFTLQ